MSDLTDLPPERTMPQAHMLARQQRIEQYAAGTTRRHHHRWCRWVAGSPPPRTGRCRRTTGAPAIERWKADGFFVGAGTDTAGAVRRHYAGHDRVVIVTDEQAGSIADVSSAMPANRPMYTWNLAGYQRGHAPSGGNRWTFGGLTDAGFRMLPLLESGRDGDWPF